MREIYIYDAAAPGSVRPANPDNADPDLLQAAKADNLDVLEAMFACGDESLVYMTAFRHPRKACGLITVVSGGEALFCVIANTNLDLIAAASHFSGMVSNVRYGADIFENAGDE